MVKEVAGRKGRYPNCRERGSRRKKSLRLRRFVTQLVEREKIVEKIVEVAPKKRDIAVEGGRVETTKASTIPTV